MSIISALASSGTGRRRAATRHAPDVAGASVEVERVQRQMHDIAARRTAATAELADLRARRPALILAGNEEALDALERSITEAERTIERADLTLPELRRQSEAAGVDLQAAKLAKHRERHRTALSTVLAALDQLAKANETASAVMEEAARDLGTGAAPWRITYFERTLPGSVKHWRDLTLAELDRAMSAEVAPRIVLVRLLKDHPRFGNAGEVRGFPKAEADKLVTPRGLVPAVAEFVDPFERVEPVTASPQPPAPEPAPSPIPPLPIPPLPKPALVVPPPGPDGRIMVRFLRACQVAARTRFEDMGHFGPHEEATFIPAQAVRLVEGRAAEFVTAETAPAAEGPADAA